MISNRITDISQLFPQKESQVTNQILMIRPVDFKFNIQTASNNKFQEESTGANVQQLALQEFDQFTEVLKDNGIELTIIQDILQPETPDSIFPNNWISLHHNGQVYLYPMFSQNRRLERRQDILETLQDSFKVIR
jgi:hypothetical protein